MTAINMAQFIAPKSDQLNSDDLIGGPRTITITRVTGNEGNAEQPVNVFFEGDNGKPFRPCKSMRRVMVTAWGADASQYAGRSMTIYRDPKVQFGGMAVGGIRISHMSHIERDMVMSLTASKAKRAPCHIKVLTVPQQADKAADWTRDHIAAIAAAEDVEAAIAAAAKAVARLERDRPELFAQVQAAYAARREVEPVGRSDEQHGDQFDAAEWEG